jgi:hypothetical protein
LKDIESPFLAQSKNLNTVISFVMSVRPSVRPSVRMEELGSHWTDFLEILCLLIFPKSVKKIKVSFKFD